MLDSGNDHVPDLSRNTDHLIPTRIVESDGLKLASGVGVGDTDFDLLVRRGNAEGFSESEFGHLKSPFGWSASGDHKVFKRHFDRKEKPKNH
jgi:hypothetical protein